MNIFYNSCSVPFILSMFSTDWIFPVCLSKHGYIHSPEHLTGRNWQRRKTIKLCFQWICARWVYVAGLNGLPTWWKWQWKYVIWREKQEGKTSDRLLATYVASTLVCTLGGVYPPACSFTPTWLKYTHLWNISQGTNS